MWQLESAATSASSGSTASARDSGTRTESGEEEAGTVTPPSNDHRCARLNLMSVNASSAPRFHEIVAVYSCAMPCPLLLRWFRHEGLVGGPIHQGVELGGVGDPELEEPRPSL